MTSDPEPVSPETDIDQPPKGWAFGLWIVWAWVAMSVTHELGHVLVGMLVGAKLIVLEIRPWQLPHSIHAGDPYPLLTLWGGPLVGCALPLGVAFVARRTAPWFVAWFCVTANSVYLLLGYYSADPELDSTKMLRAGTPAIVLIGVALTGLLIGYPRFRHSCIGLLSGKVSRGGWRGFWISVTLLGAILVLQAIVGSLVIHN